MPIKATIPDQIQITASRHGVVHFAFSGKSDASTTPMLARVVESRLKACSTKKLVLDLTNVHTIWHNAGRVLDLARCVSQGRLGRAIPVEYRIRNDVYSDLLEITPSLPALRPGKKQLFEGVTIEVHPPSLQLPSQRTSRSRSLGPKVDIKPTRPISPRKLLYSYEGMIRSIEKNIVQVSLFTDEGEVLGELDRTMGVTWPVVAGVRG
jgi:hypothetical protein